MRGDGRKRKPEQRVLFKRCRATNRQRPLGKHSVRVWPAPFELRQRHSRATSSRGQLTYGGACELDMRRVKRYLHAASTLQSDSGCARHCCSRKSIGALRSISIDNFLSVFCMRTLLITISFLQCSHHSVITWSSIVLIAHEERSPPHCTGTGPIKLGQCSAH